MLWKNIEKKQNDKQKICWLEKRKAKEEIEILGLWLLAICSKGILMERPKQPSHEWKPRRLLNPRFWTFSSPSPIWKDLKTACSPILGSSPSLSFSTCGLLHWTWANAHPKWLKACLPCMKEQASTELAENATFLSWDRRKRVLPPLATSLSCCKCSGSDNQPVMGGNYSWDGVEWRSASTCTSHSAQLFLMAFHINAERQRNVDHKYSLLPIGCKSCHWDPFLADKTPGTWWSSWPANLQHPNVQTWQALLLIVSSPT